MYNFEIKHVRIICLERIGAKHNTALLKREFSII